MLYGCRCSSLRFERKKCAIHLQNTQSIKLDKQKSKANSKKQIYTHFPLLEIELGVIEALVDAGASLTKTSESYNIRYFTPRLALACYFLADSRLDILELLLSCGAKINAPVEARAFFFNFLFLAKTK